MLASNLLMYSKDVSQREVTVVENLWRHAVNESIAKHRHERAQDMACALGMPVDVWLHIYTFVYACVPYICNVTFVDTTLVDMTNQPYRAAIRRIARHTGATPYAYEVMRA